ncbi:MAG: hypothetical protein IPJ58_02905 [Ardenticatenia bacterium]|nr:hypothetical protein [Ardenticatenia bacterium]
MDIKSGIRFRVLCTTILICASSLWIEGCTRPDNCSEPDKATGQASPGNNSVPVPRSIGQMSAPRQEQGIDAVYANRSVAPSEELLNDSLDLAMVTILEVQPLNSGGAKWGYRVRVDRWLRCSFEGDVEAGEVVAINAQWMRAYPYPTSDDVGAVGAILITPLDAAPDENHKSDIPFSQRVFETSGERLRGAHLLRWYPLQPNGTYGPVFGTHLAEGKDPEQAVIIQEYYTEQEIDAILGGSE